MRIVVSILLTLAVAYLVWNLRGWWVTGMNPVAVFLLAALMLVFAAINGLLIRRLRRRRTVLWALLVLGIVIPLACSLYFEKENPGGIPRRYIQVAR